MQPKSDTSGSGHTSLLPIIQTSTSHNTEELKDAVRRWKSRKTTSSPAQKTQQPIRSAASPHSPPGDVKISAIALAVDNAVTKQAADPPYPATSAKDFAGPLTFETIMRMKKKSRTDTKPAKAAPAATITYPKNPLTSGGPATVTTKAEEPLPEAVTPSLETSTPLFPLSVPSVDEVTPAALAKEVEEKRPPVADPQAETEPVAQDNNENGAVGGAEAEIASGHTAAVPAVTQIPPPSQSVAPITTEDTPALPAEMNPTDEPTASAPNALLEKDTEPEKIQPEQNAAGTEPAEPLPTPSEAQQPAPATMPSDSAQPTPDIAESRGQVIIAVAPPAPTPAQNTTSSATTAVAPVAATITSAKKVKKPAGTPNNETSDVAMTETALVAVSVKPPSSQEAGASKVGNESTSRPVAPPTSQGAAAVLSNPLREPPQPPSAFRSAQAKKFVGEAVSAAKSRNATPKVGTARVPRIRADDSSAKALKLPPRPPKAVSERSASAPQPANSATAQRTAEAPKVVVVATPALSAPTQVAARPPAVAPTPASISEQPSAPAPQILTLPPTGGAPPMVAPPPPEMTHPAAVLKVRRVGPPAAGETADPVVGDAAMEDAARHAALLVAAADDKMEERSPLPGGAAPCEGADPEKQYPVDVGHSAATKRSAVIEECQSLNAQAAYRYSNDYPMRSVRSIPPEMMDSAHLHMLAHPAYVMPVYARPPEPVYAPEPAAPAGPSPEETLRLRREASVAWQRRIEQVTYDSVEVLVRDLEKICAGELARLPSDEQTAVLEHRDRLLKNLLGTIRI